MSLPACQQRVLNDIEKALRASEPRLAAMYAIFTRLNAGEPVGAESLGRGRLPRRGTAVCAAVLVPVMFAMIAIGALLSGSARGATTCGVSHPATRGAPWVSHGSCQVGQATETKMSANSQPAPGSATPGKQQEHVRASCVVRMRNARRTASQPVSPPAARSQAPAIRSAAC